MDVAGAAEGDHRARWASRSSSRAATTRPTARSGTSFRGPGMDEGLEILAKVKRELGVPVLTDVHSEDEIAAVAAVVDVLQTPAFLCRQTDFIRAVAQSRQAGEHQEGPVPRAARHEERDRQGARRGAREGPARRQLHGLRARRQLRLQQPGVATCARWRSCARPARRWCSTPRTRCSCPAARAPASGGQREIRAGAGARGGGRRRGRPVHGNPSRPGQGA